MVDLDNLEASISTCAYPRSGTGYAHRFRLGTGTVSVPCHTRLNLFKHGCTRCGAASDADCAGYRRYSVSACILVSLRRV